MTEKGHFLRTFNSKTLIQLKLVFSIYKNSVFHLCPNVARFLKNSFSWTIRHLKRKILEGQEFQGDADEKMRRMRLGQVLVGAGFPPLG